MICQKKNQLEFTLISLSLTETLLVVLNTENALVSNYIWDYFLFISSICIIFEFLKQVCNCNKAENYKNVPTCCKIIWLWLSIVTDLKGFLCLLWLLLFFSSQFTLNSLSGKFKSLMLYGK